MENIFLLISFQFLFFKKNFIWFFIRFCMADVIFRGVFFQKKLLLPNLIQTTQKNIKLNDSTVFFCFVVNNRKIINKKFYVVHKIFHYQNKRNT